MSGRFCGWTEPEGESGGMKSRVHPKYKTKYRDENWASYDRALVRRGDVTVWLSPVDAQPWASTTPDGKTESAESLRARMARRLLGSAKRVGFGTKESSNANFFGSPVPSELLALLYRFNRGCPGRRAAARWRQRTLNRILNSRGRTRPQRLWPPRPRRAGISRRSRNRQPQPSWSNSAGWGTPPQFIQRPRPRRNRSSAS